MNQNIHATQEWTKDNFGAINSIEGDIIKIEDSSNLNLKNIKIYGKTTQVQTTGAQLLPYPYFQTTRSENGIDFTDIGDGGILINGTASQDTFFVFESTHQTNKKFIKAGTYYFGLSGAFSGLSASVFLYPELASNQYTRVVNFNNSFTIDADMYYGCYIKVASGTTVTKQTIYPMLSIGNSAKPYEPYTGGAASPSVEYSQKLVSVGSGGSIRADVYSGNLIPFPYEKTEHTSNGVTFVVNDDGSITVNGTATADAYFNFANAKLLKGTYCLSGCPSGGSATTYYLHLRGYDYDTGKGAAFTVKTSWSNNYQIMIKSGYTANNLVFRPQLNIGLSAAPYEKGGTVQSATFNTPNGLPGLPVASDGNYTDENGQQWICDEIDLARGKYVQRIYKYINTGERCNGNCFVNASTNTAYFNYQLLSPAVKFVAISTHFKNTATWREVETIPYMMHITASHLYFSAYADDIGVVGTETLDERRSLVSAWLAKTFSTENPLIVYYALETPIETDLTEEEISQYKALTMHKPITNIFNDASAYMSVEYVIDTKTYIDNKFAELQNAILSLGGNI